MYIPIKVCKDFEISLNHMSCKYGEDFELLNGFHESQLNFSDFINGFIDKNVADVTIDASANASTKDIRSLIAEKGKSHDKLFGFNKIFYELKKKYGLKVARKWLETEYNGGFYLHDAPSATMVSYCYAYDLTRLATEGLFFINNYNIQPPKHLTTFMDDVIEFISYFCNRTSGAVGLPNLLIWTFYFWKKDCETGYVLRDPDYYIRQTFQKLIYRLNQPFLRLNQPAFVNVSIFDHHYLEALFGGVEYPDGTFAIDYMDDLIEHQKIFMEVVSDIRHSTLFTYPVLTYSLLKRDDITPEEAKEMIRTKDYHVFVDNEFARWCSDHNCLWNDSNFFMSDNVGTLSNCCFGADEKVVVNVGGKVISATFKELYDQGVVKCEVPHAGGWAGASLIRLPRRRMFEVTTEDAHTMIVSDNHIFPTGRGDVEVSKLQLDDMLLIEKDWNYIKESVARGVPVTEDELGTEWAGYELIQVSSIKRCEYDDQFIYCFQMDDQEDPYFTLTNGIITHNCRLLSDTSKLDAFINSIGGTALSIGSVKVNTINLMRIALETRGMENREEKYLEILRDRAILCCQTLDIIRHIIQRNIEKGLLPNFCRGGVEMSKLYNTIGILATYEAVKDFGYIVKDSFDSEAEDGFCGVKYTDEGIAFASKIFEVLNDVKDNFTDDYSINIESVPRMSGHEAA